MLIPIAVIPFDIATLVTTTAKFLRLHPSVSVLEQNIQYRFVPHTVSYLLVVIARPVIHTWLSMVCTKTVDAGR